ncbi:glutaredoxin-3-like [Lineus longissimus]|uniref:glutaredoxin-3-like n=1 Tax=Lineus longissimus TaxID=88925 RepID=UPI002B4CB503
MLLKPSNSSEFNKILSDYKSCVLVVHFSAEWSKQCEQMNEVLAEIMKDVPSVNIKFIVVEAEGLPEVSQKYEIEAVPTFVFIKDDSVVYRLNGAHPPELTKKVKTFAESMTGVATASSPPAEEDLNARLKTVINQSPVMLFMKGTQAEPKCKFSREIVGIFKQENVKYGSFNILEDNSVREGLKKYSNWPTYPQLYIDGELIGGLDIIKQMIEDNEFQSSLPKTGSKDNESQSVLPKSGSLDDRLKALVNKAPVMLFMKGSPDAPQCGFSRTTVGILNDTEVKYETFDILKDEEVRQGLKKFSDWPTYPQLYVNGELIGGLDIIRALLDSEELESTLGL